MAQVQEHNIQEPETQGTQSQCHSQWFNYESQPLLQAVWGRLIAKQTTLKSLGKRKLPIIIINNKEPSSTFDLCDESFTTGRGPENNLVLNTELSEYVLARISKVHFEIVRDLSAPLNPVYIKDCSRNGTFINGEKLGKDNTRILKSGDTISVAHPTYKTFVFNDLNVNPVFKTIPDDIVNKYYIGDSLGSGACGIVHKIYNLKTCEEHAMKIIKKNLISDSSMTNKKLNDPKHIMNEVIIMKALQHPCVIKMHDIVDKPDAVYIILELMRGGDLLNRIIRNKRLTERMSKFFFYQMCHAIKYLHDQGITHRDIKPDNILLETHDNDAVLKLSDFGLSKFVRNDTVMQTICGTPSYVAPEILSTHGRGGAYTKKVDIWSLGVVLFTCLSGVLPFSDSYGSSASDQIMKGLFSFKHYSWKTVSGTAQNLISKMLTVDPNKRPSIDEVINHEWLVRDFKTVQKALHVMKIEPNKNNIYPDEENFLEPPAKRIRRL